MRRKVREILLQIAVICSLDCIAAAVLDWYNPYMNFTGHSFFLQITLYLTVGVLFFLS
ncbi:MAG: hypothetical protein Q4C60_04750 [Eubacteriales bacterium]|nr:hypothetical protein [Eubacteriales bacterium]